MSTNAHPTRQTQSMSRAEKFREALYMVTESGKTTEVMAKHAILLTNELHQIEAKLQNTNAASPQAPELMARATLIREEIQQNEKNIVNTRKMAYCILRDTYNADAVTQVDPLPNPPLPPCNNNPSFPEGPSTEAPVTTTTHATPPSDNNNAVAAPTTNRHNTGRNNT
eukprot:3937859-Rhodomonas_salina.1